MEHNIIIKKNKNFYLFKIKMLSEDKKNDLVKMLNHKALLDNFKLPLSSLKEMYNLVELLVLEVEKLVKKQRLSILSEEKKDLIVVCVNKLLTQLSVDNQDILNFVKNDLGDFIDMSVNFVNNALYVFDKHHKKCLKFC